MNFDKDVFRTKALSGSSPSATDADLRRPIYGFAELGLRGKFISIELTNAEDVGGALKINSAALYVKKRAVKGSIAGD
jgi:hypothetical protein